MSSRKQILLQGIFYEANWVSRKFTESPRKMSFKRLQGRSKSLLEVFREGLVDLFSKRLEGQFRGLKKPLKGVTRVFRGVSSFCRGVSESFKNVSRTFLEV